MAGVKLHRRGPLREGLKRFRRWWRRWRADVHLISYPKCGRTWLVLLIAEALQSHYGIRKRNPLRLREFQSRRFGIPYIHQHHDGGPEFLLPEELERDKSHYAGRKVILLVRDPRDVFVSSYFQKLKRNYNYEGSMQEYLKERRGGVESIVEFYNIWADQISVPDDFLLVTYEDLHADTAGELRRVLQFVGLPEVGDDAIVQAVESCSFNRMRELEANNVYRTGALSARDRSDLNSYKTREGRVGGYSRHLDEPSVAEIDGMIDAQLDTMYERYRLR
ncbi:MAG: sulfotransferase domain-containing protein [Halofilum sp. (in: g-proteobacteria)]